MNPSRTPLIAGNWKMYKGGLSGITLAQDVVKFAKDLRRVDIVIAPPYTALAAIATELSGSSVQLGAQNLYPKAEGAFTGEISAPFLRECGASWVIVGHSERRQYFAESDAFVADK